MSTNWKECLYNELQNISEISQVIKFANENGLQGNALILDRVNQLMEGNRRQIDEVIQLSLFVNQNYRIK